MTYIRRHTFLPVLSIEEDETGRLTGKLDFSSSYSESADIEPGTRNAIGDTLDETDERVAAAVRAFDAYLRSHPGLLASQVFGNVNDHKAGR